MLWLLIANVVASIVAVGVSLWGKTSIADFEAGTATLADLDRFDSLNGVIGLIQSILFVAAGIAWLAWSSRTVDNEEALGIGPSNVGPRMAMVWWFVPLANLVMVPATHREIYHRYHRGVVATAAIVYAWFLVYLVNNTVTTIAGTLWAGADEFTELQEGLNLWVVSDVLNVASAMLAIVLVRRIQARADILAASGTEGAPAVPPAISPAAAGIETNPDPAAPSTVPPEPSESAPPASAPDPPRW